MRTRIYDSDIIQTRVHVLEARSQPGDHQAGRLTIAHVTRAGFGVPLAFKEPSLESDP